MTMRWITCEVSKTRAGEEEPCDKLAVGYLNPAPWEDEEFGPHDPYPACAYHLHMSGGRAVILDCYPDHQPPRRSTP